MRVKKDKGFSADTEFVGLSLLETKQEVLEEVKNLYPELFADKVKVPQRTKKDEYNVPFVKIYPSTEYWEEKWLEKIPCTVCGKSGASRIELQNKQLPKKPYFCSSECSSAYNPLAERMQIQEEHYNNICPYYYIYKVTNKEDGKCYVGFTERQPFFRWYEHLVHSNLPFGQTLNKLGLKAFIFEILEEVPKIESSIEEMHRIESEYIEKYNSISNGYNMVVSIRN